MGVKSIFHELKLKVSRSRLFKALIAESQDVLPNANTSIKTIDIVEGKSATPGCVYKTTFVEGGPVKYVKNRIDEIDSEKCVCKYTTVESDAFGEKLEKICSEIKIEETGDGGCVLKMKSEYHTKAGVELSDVEMNAGKQQSEELYKICEGYLLANPHVCA